MIREIYIAGAALVLSVFFQTPINGLECLSCNRVAHISDCLYRTAVCKDAEEQCYLDKVITPNLIAVFNAGCRAKLICDLIGGVGRRSASKRQSTACAQCCNRDPDVITNTPCNGFLCNQVPVPPGDTCAVCDRTSNVQNCTVEQHCPNNQICSVKTFISSSCTFVYELGCEQKTICDQILKNYKETVPSVMPIGSGRRAGHEENEICVACCTGRNCNKADCFQLIKNQTCIDKTICGP